MITNLLERLQNKLSNEYGEPYNQYMISTINRGSLSRVLPTIIVLENMHTGVIIYTTIIIPPVIVHLSQLENYIITECIIEINRQLSGPQPKPII